MPSRWRMTSDHGPNNQISAEKKETNEEQQPECPRINFDPDALTEEHSNQSGSQTENGNT